MQRPGSWAWLIAFGVSSLLLLPSQGAGAAAAPEPRQPGVVVEGGGGALASGSPAADAGFRDGDLLLSWERLPQATGEGEAPRGEIASIVEWLWVSREELPRGPVRLLGLRNGESLALEVTSLADAIPVRPAMDAESLSRYRAAQALPETGGTPTTGSTDPASSRQAEWSALAQDASSTGNWQLAWWLLLETARAHTRARQWEPALEAYGAASALLDASESTDDGAATLVRVEGLLGRGGVLARQGAAAAAVSTFEEAIAATEQGLEGSLSLVRALQELGQFHAARGQIAEAQAILERSLAAAEATAPGSVPLATSLRALAQLGSRTGNLDTAEEYANRAVQIHEQRAPGSLTLAATLGLRGTLAAQRGQIAVATGLMERAAAIQERLDPGGLDLARTWNNLGIQAWLRGDLATAESYYTRSLTLKQLSSPEDPSLAGSLNNLGVVASQRGDLVAAEAYFERALAIWEARAPNSPEIGSSLANLSSVAERRGNLDRAQAYLERSLGYYRDRAPQSDEVAGALANLGTFKMTQGDFDAAEQAYEQALAIAHQVAAAGPRVARIQHNRGSLASRRGDLAAAQAYYQEALVLKEQLAPGSLEVAKTLAGLGDVALRHEDLDAAEELFRRALALVERWAPNSIDAAELWSALGQIERARGQAEAAVDSYTTAVATLERQVGRLGGSEDSRARFRAEYLGDYQDLIEVLLDLGRTAEAFQVLERSRARGLLAMLAERDLVFALDLPAELEAERRTTNTARDRVQSQLLAASTEGDAGKAEKLQARLREIEQQQGELRERILQVSPRVAALEYPQPLDLLAAQASLDPGTLLLSYSVHPDQTVLFVLPAQGNLRAIKVPIGEPALRALVDQFREAIWASGSSSDELADLLAVGTELDRLLVLPAEAEIAVAERLLVVADGPLHLLPFAAIPRPTIGESAGDHGPKAQFLIARKPIHLAPSVTVYEQLRRTRRTPGAAGELVAFGDPSYVDFDDSPASNTVPAADRTLRSAVARGWAFAPLPATRVEVEAIGRIWGEDAVVYLGENATEERAKQVGSAPRLLHFAVHGILDESFPLSSGLALSLRGQPAPDQDNGLLEAWEIFEQVRLDADLVTLSACETGRGREVGGEGLIGLTRAFQYAGARAVLASLWSVADDSTAALMLRFYRNLRDGKSKDEALRQAQLDLLSGRASVTRPGGTIVDTSAPHAWASFGLNGDWR